MPRDPYPDKWCESCHSSGCSRCVPPRQYLHGRCAWCGEKASSEFCGLACAASSFEAHGLWSQFATDALQQQASDEPEAVIWKFGDADRTR